MNDGRVGIGVVGARANGAIHAWLVRAPCREASLVGSGI
jgi:hypothetical protein